MIVMKFGGSSLASSASIKKVAGIVAAEARKDEPAGKPVVVVSAIGATTDQLLEILNRASRAETYATWKLHEELKNLYFCVARDLLAGAPLESVECLLRKIFRDLHLRIVEVCEGECSVTPELRDWFTSIGERLSSRIVAAAFQQNGIPAIHVDSASLI